MAKNEKSTCPLREEESPYTQRWKKKDRGGAGRILVAALFLEKTRNAPRCNNRADLLHLCFT